MLSQDERRRLHRIERRLRRDDPAFDARMGHREDGAARPPLLCCVIWLLVPVLAVTGRWPGAVAVAVLAAGLTVALLQAGRARPARRRFVARWPG